jgi:hypothetical protein
MLCSAGAATFADKNFADEQLYILRDKTFSILNLAHFLSFKLSPCLSKLVKFKKSYGRKREKLNFMQVFTRFGHNFF